MKTWSALFGCLILFLTIFVYCSHEPISPAVPGSDRIKIRFHQYGGWVGSDLLLVNDDNTASFSDNITVVNGVLEQTAVDEIIESVYSSGFFFLQGEYKADGHIYDASSFDISCKIGPYNKRVFFEYGAGPKESLTKLYEIFFSTRQVLIDSCTSGFLRIGDKMELKTWPFEESIPLLQNTGNTVHADEEVFNFFKDLGSTLINIYFFDGQHAYRINHSGGLSLNYSDINFTITVNNRIDIEKWPDNSGIRISDISDNGLFVSGDLFKSFKSELYPYPAKQYYADDVLMEGSNIYSIFLRLGDYLINIK